MKNSKEYSPKIEKLLKALKKDAGTVPPPPTYGDPAEAVVFAFVGAFTTDGGAVRTGKRIRDHFIDMNDLRVSRQEEILEVFGDASPAAAATAQALTTTLNAIFEKYDKVSLAALVAEGKRQAKKELEDIAGITPFVAAYTFLTALGGHAIPLTDKMVDYLRQHEMVHPDATLQEIESFLERHISAADAYTFYTLLRAAAEGGVKSAGSKTASKTAAKSVKKKKAAKKKASKK